MTKKSTTTRPTFSLHQLLGALSYWGTATRVFLYGILAFAIYIVALSETTTIAGFETQTMILIYVLASFLILDFGYVMIARTYTLQKGLDMFALLGSDVILGTLYIVPKIVVNPHIAMRVDPLTYVVFIPIVVLGLRMLLGILFGGRQR